MEKSELLDDESDESYFLHFLCFFLLSCCLLLDFLYLLSLDKKLLINGKSDDYGSDSGSSGTYSFVNIS